MATNADILQGHLTQIEFDAIPTFVLGDGQIVWLKDNSGNYKKGDGITQLSALPFLGTLGYTAENIANKGNVLGNLTSTTIYTHAKAVVDYVASFGFITNVITALGYTPANKAGDTFTGSIFATNLSGTNTGDETTATIQSKRPLKTIEGQSLEGIGNIDLNKSDIGLGNVDNTSDVNKPVSTAQQTALNLKENTANKQNSLTIDGTGVKFPTVDAINTALSALNLSTLIRQEFSYTSGAQTFTLTETASATYAVFVNGQELNQSQYTVVGTTLTILDTLLSGYKVNIIYSNVALGINPSYTKLEVDALLAIADSNALLYAMSF